MTRRRLIAAAAVVLAAAAIAVAAGGGGRSSGAAAATCASGRPVALAVPVPHGTLVASQRRGLAGYRIVQGFVPGTLVQARDWFRRTLPHDGYRIYAGDAEQYEADAAFRGHGVDARLRLRDLGCRGWVTLELAVR